MSNEIRFCLTVISSSSTKMNTSRENSYLAIHTKQSKNIISLQFGYVCTITSGINANKSIHLNSIQYFDSVEHEQRERMVRVLYSWCSLMHAI